MDDARAGRRDVDMVGVRVNFMDTCDVPAVIDRWRQSGRRGYVTLMNPHSVMTCRRDPEMRDATRGASLTLPDGVGVVIGARILGHGLRRRVAGPSLMLHLCDAGRAMGLRHYFYGGREGVAERLAGRLVERYPGLAVAGTYCPPFRELTSQEDAAVVARINAARPDVVWVGIGAPKQEKWMAAHQGRIQAAAMLGVGAAFDFHSGNVRWAPRWVRKIGCEWAYRLAMEPRRMWRRNLDSPLFLLCVTAQAAGAALHAAFRRAKPIVNVFFPDDGMGGNGAAPAGGSAGPVRLPPTSDDPLVVPGDPVGRLSFAPS